MKNSSLFCRVLITIGHRVIYKKKSFLSKTKNQAAWLAEMKDQWERDKLVGNLKTAEEFLILAGKNELGVLIILAPS